MPSGLNGLGERPLIMGILNVTHDSFSDGGKFIKKEDAIKHAFDMAEHGADIIDIGGESSRPGSYGIALEEELRRVLPVIEAISSKVKIPISIDSVKSEVAARAIDAGASIINDISAMQFDQEIGKVAFKSGAWLILMHMRGTPATMQDNTEYDDIINEISEFLNAKALDAIRMGVSKDRIIIDPGIGFGKSTDGNFTILKNLHRFAALGYPVLAGASRKSFLGKELGLDADNRLEGSLAAACYAVLNGADIVRVHDVAETKKALAIIEKIVRA
jgi:dihydropteroate synthase